MKILIENSSQENEIVFDPFIGVGATAIACIETNRNYIVNDLSFDYYNVTTNRIEEYKRV